MKRWVGGREEVPDTAAVSADRTIRTAGWWLYCMINSGHPLREKMTLFWHNHFATSIAKVHSPVLMFQQNKLLRQHALGKFGPFLLDMSKDAGHAASGSTPTATSRATPTRTMPAKFRNCSASASATTPKRTSRKPPAPSPAGTPTANNSSSTPACMTTGEKVYHGVKGNLNGDDIVAIILKQPAAAPGSSCASCIASSSAKLTTPPAKLLEPLAEQFRKSDYDIADLVKTMISSNHFFSEYAFRHRVKSPVEYVLGAVQATAKEPGVSAQPAGPAASIRWVRRCSPRPTSRAGRAGNWLSTATVLARQNFGQRWRWARCGTRRCRSSISAGESRPRRCRTASRSLAIRTQAGQAPKQPAKPEEAGPDRAVSIPPGTSSTSRVLR